MRCTLLAVLISVAVIGPTCGQTVGVPFLNDLFIDPGAGGAPGGPPGGAPCLTVPPFPIPPLTPFTVNVSTAAPGLTVVIVLDFPAPCLPGAFCLPPAVGIYGAIPPVPPFSPCLAPFFPPTNQTIDLAPTPTSFVGFTGLAAPTPLGPGGLFTTFAITSPGIGIPIAMQAYIFDPAAVAGPFPFIVTNAVEIII